MLSHLADLGSKYAQCTLAFICISLKKEWKQSFAEARTLLRKAADQNHAKAKNEVGENDNWRSGFQEGSVLDGYILIDKAAKQGNDEAENFLTPERRQSAKAMDGNTLL